MSEERAIVRIGFPWWMRPFLMRGVAAITLGRRIWIRPGEESETLLSHELTHVRQMRDLGVLRFGWRYLGEYVRNRLAGMRPDDAYRNISFEREAFSAETYNRRTSTDG
ncbi:MAG TPA: DUF4157 domain-containing protein [Thermoanaerobaculia bacterium]|nr:DUF4157 domain-containing protein [Thermoanaerobaculia bacterium]